MTMYLDIGLFLGVALVLSVGGYLGYLFVEDRWEKSYIRNEILSGDDMPLAVLFIVLSGLVLVILWAPALIIGVIAGILIGARAMRRVQKKVAKL